MIYKFKKIISHSWFSTRKCKLRYTILPTLFYCFFPLLCVHLLLICKFLSCSITVHTLLITMPTTTLSHGTYHKVHSVRCLHIKRICPKTYTIYWFICRFTVRNLLIGIVVKNGIVLIDYTNLCRERGKSAIQSTVTAARSRLRPVLMTTITTVLGMIPMAVSHGEGSAMWRPLGIAVIGGLSISTILTLILVPVLYCVFQGVEIKKTRRKLRRQMELAAYWAENKKNMIRDKNAKISYKK